MNAIILPVLGANMSHGTVRRWFKQEGERVEVGDPLFEVETDKVNAEVEAEADGVLRRIVAAPGAKVEVLGIVGFVGGPDEPLPSPDTWASLLPRLPGEEPEQVEAELAGAAVRERTGRVAASPAARRLAKERGISLAEIRGTGPNGEITRADVEAATVSVAVVEGGGLVDEEFLALLRRDPESFRALASEMKVRLYRQHGADIGDRVRIESGAVVLAREMRLATGVTIGADSTMDCARLILGRLTAFGKRTRVKGHTIRIGDALWSKDDVMIGGGGSHEPGARLEAGDACFFGEGAYINVGHPVTLGDEVCIGSRAMLFTHSHWQSVLRGYASVFGPITIEDHVFLGNNVFVFPGVTIGAGATVMVNSFVALNVSPAMFVGGVPAQAVREIVAPSHAEQVRIVETALPELKAVLAERGLPTDLREGGGQVDLVAADGRVVAFRPEWSGPAELREIPRSVVLAFVTGEVGALPPGMTLFDLRGSRVYGMQDRLSDEVREFLRRRGIRFRPFAWRHGVGHFDGDTFYPRS